jgi:rod shape determining protein RodA
VTTGSKLVNKIDWITLGLYLLLVILGWFNIYSSAYDGSSFEMSSRYGKQLIVIIINVILLITFMFVNAHIVPAVSYIFYGIMVLSLIAVLFLGNKTGGSRSWFIIGSFKLQPAEFAKLATALALAKLLGTESFKFMRNIKDFITVAALLLIPPMFIILQGDAGSALVFSAFVIVLYREGLPFYWLLAIFIEVLVFIAYFFLPFYLVFIFLILSAITIYGRQKKCDKYFFSISSNGDRRFCSHYLCPFTY